MEEQLETEGIDRAGGQGDGRAGRKTRDNERIYIL